MNSTSHDAISVSGFVTTSWTLVRQAAQGGEQHSRDAWETLARRYWRPLYLHCRQRGDPPDVAEDRVQGFFAALLDGEGLAGVMEDDPSLQDGAQPRLFRSWLRASMDNFRRDEHRRSHALKRRPAQGFDPRDVSQLEADMAAHAAEPMARSFDRQWASCVLDQAREILRDRYLARSNVERFDIFWLHLLPGVAVSDRSAHAAALGLGPEAFANAVSKFRREYGKAIDDVVRETTANESDVKSEILRLIEALS